MEHQEEEEGKVINTDTRPVWEKMQDKIEELEFKNEMSQKTIHDLDGQNV